jgi:hypothetical protein
MGRRNKCAKEVGLIALEDGLYRIDGKPDAGDADEIAGAPGGDESGNETAGSGKIAATPARPAPKGPSALLGIVVAWRRWRLSRREPKD